MECGEGGPWGAETPESDRAALPGPGGGSQVGICSKDPRRGGGLGSIGPMGGGSAVRIASMEPHRAGTPCGDCGCTGGAS